MVVIEELKFLGKFTKKIFFWVVRGGWVGRGGGGSGWWGGGGGGGGGVRVDVNKEL